ncbi:MAG: hypothetical protein J5I93_24515, partial [Pirellulaceae bacterium]|nr:hypothetical protein [Pirellulaceae bacterium]
MDSLDFGERSPLEIPLAPSPEGDLAAFKSFASKFQDILVDYSIPFPNWRGKPHKSLLAPSPLRGGLGRGSSGT